MLSLKEKNAFITRLKIASFGELIYRFRELLIIWLFKAKILKLDRNNLNILDNFTYKNLRIPSLNLKVTKENVKNFLNDRINALNFPSFEINNFEEKFRKKFFSAIDWKKENIDIRIIWEVSRLQNITSLLVCAKANPDSNVSDKVNKLCLKQILKWVENNPFMFGPHYISAMECALRIPVLFYSLILLDNLKSEQIKAILETIYVHALWISKRLSLYSSTGNHTIAEGVGLIFAGSIFENLGEAKRWFNKGIQILKYEQLRQILDDGGPAEQSFNYHRFVIDLYWLAIDFLETNNLYECAELKSRLIRAEEFLLAFKSQNGYLPSIGDSDDGFAVGPGIEPKKARINYSKKKVRIFRNSGYTVINSLNGVQLIFDHGPLGMPPLYNHGHADALSVILSINGVQILVDSGTYKYNGEPEWRKYFKGTRAHNTVTIDACDQAVQQTGFIWSHPYNIDLLGFSENQNQFMINAMHDGYARLKEPVRHKRGILFFDNSCFLIKDSFIGEGVHEFAINFHLHPHTRLIKKNRWWLISNREAQIYMTLLEDSDFSIIRGSINPIYGWYSPCYGTKLKCDVMSCKKNGFPHEISFLTAICTKTLIDMERIRDRLIYID